MAHCNTIFHQMLKLIPGHHFAKLEAEHSSGRKARSFTHWSQNEVGEGRQGFCGANQPLAPGTCSKQCGGTDPPQQYS